MYCYRHSRIETSLRCGRCDRPICVQCVVYHPVGIRCTECAKSRKLPTFDVSPFYYVKGLASAIGVGIGGVALLVLANIVLSLLGLMALYVHWGTLVGIAYIMGKVVSWAVNRKRSNGLQWMVGVAVAMVYLLASSILGVPVTVFGLLVLLFAVYVAIIRLRV